jgi:hypothetical protein
VHALVRFIGHTCFQNSSESKSPAHPWGGRGV